MLELEGSGNNEVYSVNEANTELTKVVVKKAFEAPFSGRPIYFGEMGGRQVVVKKSANRIGAGDLHMEWQGLSRAYEGGFNVPEPIALADNNKIMVSSFMPGECLVNIENNNYRYELGTMVGEMHKTLEGNGKWREHGCDTVDYYEKSINGWEKSEIDELAQDSRARSLLSVLMISMSDYLEHAEAGFAHRDIHDEQVFVSDEVGVIDFEYWGDAVLAREVGLYLFHTLRRGQSVSGAEEFAKGVGETSDQALFYALFIAGNALQYYARVYPEYLPVAFHNFYSTLDYIESEDLIK